jgi:type IV secretion system protein VirB9
VYAAPLKITSIQFAPGERVESVGVGDSTRWIIGRTSAGAGSRKREVVLIKPQRAWLNTNMTITTDRRIYQLELHSYKESYMAAVSWNYPQDLVTQYAQQRDSQAGGGASAGGEKTGEAVTVGADASQLEFGYGFVVEEPDNPPSWMPLRVFDDGTKTYVHFPSHVKKRQAPALFVLSADGQTQIVNYRVKGDYYIVDRVFEMAQLRLGEKNPVTVGIERLQDEE